VKQQRIVGMSLRRPAVALVVGLALASCGLFGSDEEAEAPVDPCPRADLPARRLVGAVIREPAGVGAFEILPVDGKTRRSGQLSRLHIGDYTFKARPGADGGLDGRRGARAEPIAGLDARSLGAYAVSYTYDGDAYAGRVAIGLPAPGSMMATAGQGHYRGPVRLMVQDRRPEAAGGPVEVAGTADIQVRFGSRQVDMRFEGLAPQAGALPFESMSWTGIGMCGARVGSTGKGGFQALGAGGRAVNFVGAAAQSPGGAAALDATFYGFDAARAQPKEIGGVLLVQGDSGVISGIFAAALAD
jgi:hypothetical protein